MKLVEDWKEAYKWFSVHIAAVIGVINAAQATLAVLAPQQQVFTPAQFAAMNSVLAIALIWARLIQQGGKTT